MTNILFMILAIAIMVGGWFISLQVLRVSRPCIDWIESPFWFMVTESAISASVNTLAMAVANTLPGVNFSLVFYFIITMVLRLIGEVVSRRTG